MKPSFLFFSSHPATIAGGSSSACQFATTHWQALLLGRIWAHHYSLPSNPDCASTVSASAPASVQAERLKPNVE